MTIREYINNNFSQWMKINHFTEHHYGLSRQEAYKLLTYCNRTGCFEGDKEEILAHILKVATDSENTKKILEWYTNCDDREFFVIYTKTLPKNIGGFVYERGDNISRPRKVWGMKIIFQRTVINNQRTFWIKSAMPSGT